MALVWREQLSTGNNVIDSDHQHLIEIINLAEHGVTTRNAVELTQALNNLSQYATAHFAREERIARATGYAHVEQLHQSHDGLSIKLDMFKRSVHSEWTKESEERFCALLHDWLVDHVIKEDLKLKPLLGRFPPHFDGL